VNRSFINKLSNRTLQRRLISSRPVGVPKEGMALVVAQGPDTAEK